MVAGVTVAITKGTEQIFLKLSGEKQTIRCTRGVCGTEFRPSTAGTPGLCSTMSGISAGKLEAWSWNHLKAFTFSGLGSMRLRAGPSDPLHVGLYMACFGRPQVLGAGLKDELGWGGVWKPYPFL